MTTMSANPLPRIPMGLVAWLVFKIHSFLAHGTSRSLYIVSRSQVHTNTEMLS